MEGKEGIEDMSTMVHRPADGLGVVNQRRTVRAAWKKCFVERAEAFQEDSSVCQQMAAV